VFVSENKSLVVRLFIDNIVITAKTIDTVNKFKKGFRAIYKIKDLKEIH
jgi:hypothetical protein